MKKILLLSALAFICLSQTFAQTFVIKDPSFEDTTQGNFAPPYWDSCSNASTITTNYSFHAYAGNSYLGLGYSDFGGDSICGAVSQLLTVPFCGDGALYTGTVALSNLNNTTSSSSGLVCQICAGFNSCSPAQVLWQSPVITDSMTIGIGDPYAPNWHLETFSFNSLSAYTYIIIRVTAANYSQQTGQGGLIGVDALNITGSGCATGIQTINSTTVSLYPNPATNMVTVNSGSNAPYALSIFDLAGREITTKEMAGTGTLDVSQLSRGCYLAKVIQGGKSYCQKLIIE